MQCQLALPQGLQKIIPARRKLLNRASRCTAPCSLRAVHDSPQWQKTAHSDKNSAYLPTFEEEPIHPNASKTYTYRAIEWKILAKKINFRQYASKSYLTFLYSMFYRCSAARNTGPVSQYFATRLLIAVTPRSPNARDLGLETGATRLALLIWTTCYTPTATGVRRQA
jgi:hypothetical protein